MVNKILIKTSLKLYGHVGILLGLVAWTGATSQAWAQSAAGFPNYFDPRERMVMPDLSGRARLRFLTTLDFPPFNFLDQNERLAGFHVDLARAICAELRVAARCELQALPWDELADALEAGDGEAIIAGLAVTAANREKYGFSRPFLQLPARFVQKKETAVTSAAGLAQKRVGVIGDTAHERMLRGLFSTVEPVIFAQPAEMFTALKEGRVEAVFGNGVDLSFWLGTDGSQDCCQFLDGPFLSPHFLGGGLAIAVPQDDRVLADAFDYALLALSKNGRLAEIYLRYFPNGLY
jgi:polar amino acid transport system substrate-binding protein